MREIHLCKDERGKTGLQLKNIDQVKGLGWRGAVHGMAQRGMARHGVVHRGMAQHGVVHHSVAWGSMA